MAEKHQWPKQKRDGSWSSSAWLELIQAYTVSVEFHLSYQRQTMLFPHLHSKETFAVPMVTKAARGHKRKQFKYIVTCVHFSFYQPMSSLNRVHEMSLKNLNFCIVTAAFPQHLHWIVALILFKIIKSKALWRQYLQQGEVDYNSLVKWQVSSLIKAKWYQAIMQMSRE